MADRFLCLVKNKPLSSRDIRRTRNMILRFNVDEWGEWEEVKGKFRRIIDTQAPADHPEVSYDGTGYEEREGKLYQTWVKR